MAMRHQHILSFIFVYFQTKFPTSVYYSGRKEDPCSFRKSNPDSLVVRLADEPLYRLSYPGSPSPHDVVDN
jgi:hypothetical protein